MTISLISTNSVMAFNDPFNSHNASTDDHSSSQFNDEDPAAEFLEREKRELGDITGDDNENSFDSSRNSFPNGENTIDQFFGKDFY